jgi:hypothetical protein
MVALVGSRTSETPESAASSCELSRRPPRWWALSRDCLPRRAWPWRPSPLMRTGPPRPPLPCSAMAAFPTVLGRGGLPRWCARDRGVLPRRARPRRRPAPPCLSMEAFPAALVVEVSYHLPFPIWSWTQCYIRPSWEGLDGPSALCRAVFATVI